MSDYINEEQERTISRTVIHPSLHSGALLGLGVHDHWDSFETKSYALIDYLHVDLDHPTVHRLDVDKKVKDFKNDIDTEEKVKDMIKNYMNTES